MTEKKGNNQVNEPEASYNNSIKSTTLQKLEEETLLHTANFSPEQRMEYLYQLRRKVHEDNADTEKKFNESKIQINTSNENT